MPYADISIVNGLLTIIWDNGYDESPGGGHRDKRHREAAMRWQDTQVVSDESQTARRYA